MSICLLCLYVSLSVYLSIYLSLLSLLHMCVSLFGLFPPFSLPPSQLGGRQLCRVWISSARATMAVPRLTVWRYAPHFMDLLCVHFTRLCSIFFLLLLHQSINQSINQFMDLLCVHFTRLCSIFFLLLLLQSITQSINQAINRSSLINQSINQSSINQQQSSMLIVVVIITR